MSAFRFGKRHLIWSFCLITLMTLVSAGMNYVSYANFKDHPMGFPDVLLKQVIWWYPWMLVVPLIVLFAQRFPLDRHTWERSLLMHVPASVLFSLAHLTLFLTMCWVIGGKMWTEVSGDKSYSETIWIYWTSPTKVNFHLRVLIYIAIVMFSHAMDYYRRFENRELEASRLEAQLATAQLHALEMQLHPHFLFNTLNSISALLHRDVGAADEMLQKLIRFLHLTLQNSGVQEVTLRRELEFLKYYLEIEQVRFQDRLVVDVNVESDTLDAKVPNLIMQPIVENAIRHGIAPRAAAGRIEIRANRENGRVQLKVRDNGPGLPSRESAREGIGLSNTRMRLQQVYGERFSFDLKNAPGGGVEVTLNLPYERELHPRFGA